MEYLASLLAHTFLPLVELERQASTTVNFRFFKIPKSTLGEELALRVQCYPFSPLWGRGARKI